MIVVMVIAILACYIVVYIWLSRKQRTDKAVLFMITPTVESSAIPDGLRQFYRITQKSCPKACCYVAFAEGCSSEHKKIAKKAQNIYHYEIYHSHLNDKIFQKIYLFVDLRQGF